MSDDDSSLAFVTETLPEFIVDEPYEVWLEVDGAVQPVTFEIEDGQFPGGIGLSSEGMVYGTPVNDTTDTTVFVTVSDSTGASETQAFDCEVHKPKGDDDSD